MNNAFSDALGLVGVDAFFAQQEGDQYSVLRLDDIDVKPQVREEFEDAENTLADLAESIKAVGVLQPILVRPLPNGRYELVAGERRFRASILAGKDTIPVLIREMTDEQVEELQLAENIHRKNLTQVEVARRLQRDLDRLEGNVEALMAKHHKSRGWVSKMLGLLNLPEQTQRLVDEDVSADLAVINTVKVIEKADPVAARELVDDLKAGRSKGNARDKVQAVKERVKPSVKSSKAKAPTVEDDETTVATPRDRSDEAPGEVRVSTPDQVEDRPVAFAPAAVLRPAFGAIVRGKRPAAVLDAMDAAGREEAENWLRQFYDAGLKADNVGQAVMRGLRNGQFATEDEGAFALVAFLQGVDENSKFSLLNIFGAAAKVE